MLLSIALIVGFLLAIQASANLRLNAAVGTPYGASTLQLGLATALLLALAAATGSLGALTTLDDVVWWHLLGGLASPLYITAGVLLFPRLGALTSVALFVTGQMFASLTLDLFGLLNVPQRTVTPGVIGGAIAVLAGIIAITSLRLSAGRAGWILLGLLAGAVLPVQGAINAQLRADLHEPLAVAVVSFTVATITIAVVLLVLRLLHRTPTPNLRSFGGMPWWGWLGAPAAATYVTATFMLIPTLGAATTIALIVTGQQLASAVIDHFGLFRLPRRPLTPTRLLGLTLLIAGSLSIQLL